MRKNLLFTLLLLQLYFVEYAQSVAIKWVEGGGMTGLVSILKDPKFLKTTSANNSFPFSMSITNVLFV